MTADRPVERRPFDVEAARSRAADAAYDEGHNLPRKHRVGFRRKKDDK